MKQLSISKLIFYRCFHERLCEIVDRENIIPRDMLKRKLGDWSRVPQEDKTKAIKELMELHIIRMVDSAGKFFEVTPLK